jgi:hypothetical protein
MTFPTAFLKIVAFRETPGSIEGILVFDNCGMLESWPGRKELGLKKHRLGQPPS